MLNLLRKLVTLFFEFFAKYQVQKLLYFLNSKNISNTFFFKKYKVDFEH